MYLCVWIESVAAYFVLFLQVSILAHCSLVLHPLSVGLVHLLSQSLLLLGLLMCQLRVGLYLQGRRKEMREGIEKAEGGEIYGKR